MKTKPIVHYTGPVEFRKVVVPIEHKEEYLDIMDEEGCLTTATVYDVINHPRLGYERQVRTSAVISKFDDGVFETLNTMYVKVDK